MNQLVFKQVVEEKIASLGNRGNKSEFPHFLKISGLRMPTVGERVRNSIRRRRKRVIPGNINKVAGLTS